MFSGPGASLDKLTGAGIFFLHITSRATATTKNTSAETPLRSMNYFLLLLEKKATTKSPFHSTQLHSIKSVLLKHSVVLFTGKK